MLVTTALLAAGCSGPDETPAALVSPTAATTPTATSPAVSTPAVPSPVPIEAAPDLSQGPPPLYEPGSLTSVDGYLHVDLVAKQGVATVNGTGYETILYNDRLIQPVLRLQPGDALLVELDDRRPAVPDVQAHHGHASAGAPAYADYTNVHFHGLNVPPQAPGDDVFIQVFPEATGLKPSLYRYALVLPEDHPQGLFWYHPHPHGVSNQQVRGGMSGAMIIGNLTGTHYPDVEYTRERVFLLRDFSNVSMAPGSVGAAAFANKTVNGMTWSTFDLAPGETQFWRFGNVGSNLNFPLVLTNGTANVPFYVIAVDGNVLETPVRTETLYLHPGARMEGFVVGPPEGAYVLRSLAVNNGGRQEPQADLVLVNSRPDASVPPTSTAEDILRSTNAEADARFVELRRWVEDGNATVWRNFTFHGGGAQNATINGSTYDVDRVDTTVNYGDRETWVLHNPDGVNHVFHIHQLDFLVTQVNGAPADMRGLQDTVLIPPGGNVTIVIPFTTPNTIGEYVYHCHYLAHEDNGMMANIVVR